jgi:uncharacterized protein YdiU (UPF0061 family)
MHRAEIDMSLFFRHLSRIDLDAPKLELLQDAFYRQDLPKENVGDLTEWLEDWAKRIRSEGESDVVRVARMNAVNPRYVLRNYLAQQAIDLAASGDPGMIHELLEVLRHPYDEQPDREAFAARRPEWAKHKAGCSMLSCSS